MRKIAKTVYLEPEVNEYLKTRKNQEDRTLSALVNRMLKKCVRLENEKDLAVAESIGNDGKSYLNKL